MQLRFRAILILTLAITAAASCKRTAPEPPQPRRSGESLAVQWLKRRPDKAYRDAVNASLKVGSLGYVAPTRTPYDGRQPVARAQLLKAHKAAWEAVLLQKNVSNFGRGSLGVTLSTCCEAKEPVTVGWYAGQFDALHYFKQAAATLGTGPGVIRQLEQLKEAARRRPTKNWYIPDYEELGKSKKKAQ